MQFRESVINEVKQDGTRRAARTINKELTGVGTALRYLVKRQEFSKLTLEGVLVACEHFGNEPSKSATPMVVSEIKHTLESCIEHDDATFEMTREEKNSGASASTLRNDPIGPFVAFLLLSGLRVNSEALRIEWSHVDFDSDVIHIGSWSKTRRTRRVTFAESPALRRLLDAQHELTGGKGRVWPMTYNQLLNARRRLVEVYDAPEVFGWQVCRATCQSFLASSPSVYGNASIYLTAQRGGHSVQVCERYYARAVKVADPKAGTLEAAMGIEEYVDQIIEDLEAIEVAA
jgi:integrase